MRYDLLNYDECPGSPTSPSWAGPIDGGITQSLLAKYLECPFRAMLYLVYGVEEPRPPHPNLIWGQSAHVGLEHLINTGSLAAAIEAAIDELHRWPLDLTTPEFEYSIPAMLTYYSNHQADYLSQGSWEAEVKFEIPYNTRNNTVTLRGKCDAIGTTQSTLDPQDGDYCTLVEHKFKGRIEPETAYAELPQDFQVNLYALCNDIDHCIYDIIRIPEANTFHLPRRMQTEPVRDYIQRIYHGNCGTCKSLPISKFPKLWLFQHSFDIPKQDTFINFQLNPLIDRICQWWEHVTSPSFDPTSPASYNEFFYITPVRHFDPSSTEYYHCSYHSLLTNTLDIEELTPVASFYPELSDD